ncbi:MAG: NYN domain-containing protein [Candidatus Uhrbacteria bacterium]|nr:NYN domain-containing protein [Candidatus Uhrbacteria bacterium]
MDKSLSKTKVYIDGSNVFYTQKKLGWSFDWVKFRKIIENDHDVVEWKYYVGLKDDDEKMSSYLRYLSAIGFTTITKPLKKIRIGNNDVRSQINNSFIYKANFDVEITADILLDKSNIREIILFSGDSDFEYLVRRLKDAGVKTCIFSSRKTISWELKLVAGGVVYFESMRALIERAK